VDPVVGPVAAVAGQVTIEAVVRVSGLAGLADRVADPPVAVARRPPGPVTLDPRAPPSR